MNTVRKLAFLGGTFDPVHLGHLLIAQDACEQMELDQVVFTPAARSPFKERAPVASGPERLALLTAALEGRPRFGVLDIELEAPPPSYTIDTVRRLRERYPDDQLFWIVGGDQVADLARWKDAAELVELVEFIAVERPGFPVASPDLRGLRLHRVEGHPFAVSSTEIRKRIKKGLAVDLFLPNGINSSMLHAYLYG